MGNPGGKRGPGGATLEVLSMAKRGLCGDLDQ